MELSAQDLVTVLSMLQRLREEVDVRTTLFERLIELLVNKGVVSHHDKDILDVAFLDHLRMTQASTKTPGLDAPVEELPAELTEEVKSMGVQSSPSAIIQTLETDFAKLFEMLLDRLRREEGGMWRDSESHTLTLPTIHIKY